MGAMQWIRAAAWISGTIFTIYIFYYFFISLFAFHKGSEIKTHPPQKRFAVLIAARNEACVIANLVESLRMQNYPAQLYDIVVVPNNCTDDTKQKAEEAGAAIMDCTARVKSKGEVLSFAFDRLLRKEAGYDAFCVFDADNLVCPDFLIHMNNALMEGIGLVQGYRDSKNPYDSAVSSCYAIYYCMINRFYNGARSRLGLSTMINGSGFMVSREILERMGGFHTVTMTEDLEFTTQCLLMGEKVHWEPRAVFYDEQPVAIAESQKQRRRWSTGSIQGLGRYWRPLLLKALKEGDMTCLDQLLFYLTPVMQVIYVLSLGLDTALHLRYSNAVLIPWAQAYYKMFFSLDYTYFSTVIWALLTLAVERKLRFGILKGIFTYWLFIASWIPINISCFFKKSVVWEEIRHTRSIRLSDLKNQKEKASAL